MTNTVVLQSHRSPLPHPWLETCLQSVSDWAELKQFDYHFACDELFDTLPEDLQRIKHSNRVIASDLARLLAIRNLLQQGYDTAIWCDADFLIFNPEVFATVDSDYALGREVWIQFDKNKKLRAYSKVHNAFLIFRRGNCFLDFYIETAQKLLRDSNESVPAQFIGPKLLTALHNIALCPVQETAGMLSPLVILDLLYGDGKALKLFIDKSPQPVHAANLCISSISNGELTSQNMQAAIDILLDQRQLVLQR